MHVNSMSSTKAWTIFILLSIALHFKNWINYSGRTRKVLNAKWNRIKTPKYSIPLLLVLPLLAIILGLVCLKAI